MLKKHRQQILVRQFWHAAVKGFTIPFFDKHIGFQFVYEIEFKDV